MAPVLAILGAIAGLVLVGYLAIVSQRRVARVSVDGEGATRHSGPHWLLQRWLVMQEQTWASAVEVKQTLPAVVSGLSKTQAEDLLDWLEAHGQTDWELEYEPVKGFIVRQKVISAN